MAAARCTHIFPDSLYLLRSYTPRLHTAAHRRQLHSVNRMLRTSESTGFSVKLSTARRTGFHKIFLQDPPVFARVTASRFNSTTATDAVTKVAEKGGEFIPPPPDVIPTEVYDAMFLNKFGEPTLQSLGMGSWSPPGRVQFLLETFHVNLDLPWWGAIVLMTAIIRIVMYPIVIMSKNNMVEMMKLGPETMKLKQKADRAKVQGDILTRLEIEQKQQELMAKSEANPYKMALIPCFQVPVFISVFSGLRKMTELPVESLKEGGLLWFTDLTITDPYLALPTLTAFTLWLTLRVGADGVDSLGNKAPLVKAMQLGFPAIVFLLTMRFPSALLVYWFSQNCISLLQTMLLKVPAVKKVCKIKELPKPEETVRKGDFPVEEKKGTIQMLKDSWAEQKLRREVYKSKNMDSITFEEVKLGPMKKTYSYDPTKEGAKEAAELKEKQGRLQKKRQLQRR